LGNYIKLKGDGTMINLPEVNESFGELYEILIEPIKTKLLMTGIELKVFNQLSEARPADAVAEAIGTHPVNTRLFLDGLAASDLLVKKNGLYRNTPVTQAFLTEGTPTYVGGLLISQWEFYNDMLNDLPNLVKEGPPSPSLEEDMGPEPDTGPEDNTDPEDIWKYSSMGLASFEKKLGSHMMDIVSKLPGFPHFQKMLDLGSGPGIYTIAILSSHPTMRGVIFDRAEIVKVALNYIKAYEMEDRIEILAGDYINDPIGEAYDLIWACGSLNHGKDHMDSLVKKIYDALNPQGVFISFHEGLTREQTKPAAHAILMAPMTLRGKDLCFDQGFIADNMLRAGFKSVRSHTLDTPYGPMDLDIGRKP
jgi:SAM-dependent methyltransferase